MSDWHLMDTAPRGSWPTGPDNVTEPAYIAPPRLLLLLDDGEQCVGRFDAYYAEGGDGFDGNPPWLEVVSGERIRPVAWTILPAPPKPKDKAEALPYYRSQGGTR